jgi:hypothetical protein
MTYKYYQFDYAEMQGSEVISLGSFPFSTDNILKAEHLKVFARNKLQKPEATIFISNIVRIEKEEFEKLSSTQSYH